MNKIHPLKHHHGRHYAKPGSHEGDVGATDPVCGMRVSTSVDLAADYQGQRYYFCGEHCRTAFIQSPQRYLGEEPPPKTAAKGSAYICPMCPDVRAEKPEACPKCGMALEPETPHLTGMQWTCPMHPEIVRDAPGDCPVCGMALEPVSP